jgi:dethiobiotin synthetase
LRSHSYFIAGTDTGVGKTHVTASLLAASRASGLAVAGMKPVASGAIHVDGQWVSEDALRLARASGQSTVYRDLNPYCFRDPVSPHIAAQSQNIDVDTGVIEGISARLKKSHDLLLIEGAGGWYTPISERESMADVALAVGCPVLLVVGLRLGCLNHARLTFEAIGTAGCELAGWICNEIEPNLAARDANLATLARLLGSPPLAILPFSRSSAPDPGHASTALSRLLA